MLRPNNNLERRGYSLVIIHETLISVVSSRASRVPEEPITGSEAEAQYFRLGVERILCIVPPIRNSVRKRELGMGNREKRARVGNVIIA